MNGWVKLYRDCLEHEILANDNSAFLVFAKLLLKVNRKNGKFITGRFKLGELTNLKPTTAWKTLKRLEKHKMVTLASDNKKTVIYICNWTKWQGNGDTDSDNKVTTKGQQSDTKQEVRSKNKEIVSKDTTISSLYYQVIKSLDLPVRNHKSLKSKIRELEKSSDPDVIIKYLEFMRDYFKRATWDYKPSVVEGLDIYNKRKQIEESIKRVQNKPKKGIKV